MKDEEGKLPDGWVLTKVCEVFRFRGGGTPDKKQTKLWNGDIPWASVKDIKGSRLRTTQDSITNLGLESSATSKALVGDLILVTRISPGLTVVSDIEAAINQDLKATTPPQGISSTFCHYLFDTIQKIIIERSSGTTVLGIRLAELNEIPLPLPPLNEQKRIVAKIEELFSELDAGIESIKQAKTQLGVYRQALLKKAFEGNLTAQWRSQQNSSVSATPPSPLSRSHLPLPGEELYESPQNSHSHSPPFQGGVPEGRGGLGRGGLGRGGPLNNLPHLKTFRKQLRSKMTPAEARLWTHLKGKQLDGRKFRRQHSVANYILDFYCPEERLAIELDGEVHHNVVASQYDHERDLFLQHTGIKVLRFENRIVFENSAWLLDQVRSHFGHNRTPTPPSSQPLRLRNPSVSATRSHLPLTTPPSPLSRSHLPLTGEELYEAPQNSHSHSHSPPFQGGVPEGRGGLGRGGLGRGGSQLLERIRTEREARYQQQLDDWRSATVDWEKHGKQGKKPAKPRQPKPVEPLSPEELAELPALPEGWVWMHLNDLPIHIFDGPFGSNLKTSDYVDSGVRVVRLENIGYGNFIEEKMSFVTKEKYVTLQKHTVYPGDIVFSSFINDAVRASIVPSSIETAINKADCFCARCFGNSISNDYVLQMFMVRSFYKRLEAQVHGVGRPRINTTQLGTAIIPLCPLPEQREIVRILEEQFAVIEQNEQEIDAALARAEALRQAILKKAFSGRLVPQDPNDEPASILLERIRAERAAAATQSKPSRKPPRRKSSTGGVQP